jgi:hypothetical protein
LCLCEWWDAQAASITTIHRIKKNLKILFTQRFLIELKNR